MVPASVSLSRLADDVARLPHECLILAAKRSKAIVAQEGRRVAGADGMKGKKRRGLKLTARDTIRDASDASTVRVQGSIPAWIWANTGTAPHAIRRRKRGKLRKLTVSHPGTAGHGAWDRVAERITREVPPIFERQLDQVLSHG